MLSAPEPSAGLREMSSVFELPRLLASWPRLTKVRRGAGAPVVVLPGYGAGDLSTTPIRSYLAAIGFSVRGWELGRNDGDVEALLPRVAEAVTRASERAARPVSLVGWSLGGVLAREAAREIPDRVARVVTFGTPVVGGPKYTLVGSRYAELGYDLDAIEAAIEERHRVPIRVPVTAIYSRNDGVVAWRACIDPWTPGVEHVEVRSSHVGLGIDPDVYAIVADRLTA